LPSASPFVPNQSKQQKFNEPSKARLFNKTSRSDKNHNSDYLHQHFRKMRLMNQQANVSEFRNYN